MKLKSEIQKVAQELYLAGDEGMPEESAVPSGTDDLLSLFDKTIRELVGEEEKIIMTVSAEDKFRQLGKNDLRQSILTNLEKMKEE